MKPTLYGLHYSPWTHQARWALRHHGIDYRYREHLPMLGEPLLRARRGVTGSGKVSVPMLVGSGIVITDSSEIARWADANGRGAPLFDREREDEILEIEAIAERIRQAGRALVVRALSQDPEARREELGMFPAPLRPMLDPLAKQAVDFVARKYGALDRVPAQHESAMDAGLRALRDRLGGRTYFLDKFSWADVTAATALTCVRPSTGKNVRLGPATRRCWTREALAEAYADLLAWRDAIEARHR